MRNVWLRLVIAVLTFFIGFFVQRSFQTILSSAGNLESSVVAPLKIPVPANLTIEEDYPFDAKGHPDDELGYLSGYYFPKIRKGKAKDLRIDLWITNERGTRLVEGRISTSETKFYDFTQVKVDKEKFKFQTERISGVEYRFEGTFAEEVIFGTFPDEAVLRGTLKKFVNGKKVAEIKTSFFYWMGC